ncbi:hypothetical protein R8Z50_12260 [Longispora sp. K20-0274]|uniref:hypothetical protein n=1 Tax=Longispora sp. K20-0274 TaxID=3088255 RepID=UPI00399BD7FE
MSTPFDDRQFAPPVDIQGPPEEGDAMPEVVLDFSPDEPHINWDALDRRETGMRVRVALPGDVEPVIFELDERVSRQVSEICERYQDADLPRELDESSILGEVKSSRGTATLNHASPLTKVQNLLQLQQVIETTNALLPHALDHARWKDVRPFLNQTNEDYEAVFRTLREELRNHSDGVGVLRMLLATRVQVLVHIGLRLAELEPSLGAIVQPDLAGVYADPNLDNGLRNRAFHELQGLVQHIAGTLTDTDTGTPEI